MNNRLGLLKPYPFEQLNALLSDVKANENMPFISLALGEPKHPAADFLIELLTDETFIRQGIGTYPPTKGLLALREAIANFIQQRFKLGSYSLDPETQILPVGGSREALFAFAQVVINDQIESITLLPNPFYQIYEGAALLAGSKPVFIPCTEQSNFLPDFDQVDKETWQQCQLIYICTPGNPSGAILDIEALQKLIQLSDEYNFVIASDECYSEIYADESNPPPGLLQAAAAMGRADFKNCIAFNSLSKRSNLPGLRSGYVAGEAALIKKFLLYRTYHGSAMPVHNQHLSIAAWNDEAHVIANRKLYREKYSAVLSILQPVWPMQKPQGSFYLWPQTPVADTKFAQQLLRHTNIKVLPGRYLSRTVNQQNPGQNRIRMALVATLTECVEAAERIKTFIQQEQYLDD
ncbi:MAG: succinyldiaminopimelate transaminase [Pseudomonadales bacterium]|nr:succinyldiaminopimelate transaminase [Pseudomonadales bacterium]